MKGPDVGIVVEAVKIVLVEYVIVVYCTGSHSPPTSHWFVFGLYTKTPQSYIFMKVVKKSEYKAHDYFHYFTMR